MENIKNGEQPSEVLAYPDVENNVNIKEEKSEAPETSNGSLGKFKDTESLLTAYNNLQAEFTRKCQKLKEIEKERENQSSEIENQSLFEKEDWQKEVVSFLNKNIEAKPYSKEISEILMNDKELAKQPNALDIAWAKVVQKTYKKPDEVLTSEYIDQYLSNNEEVKNKLLLEALKSVKTTSAPKVMGSNSGSISMPKTVMPITLKEAKNIVSKFFE